MALQTAKEEIKAVSTVVRACKERLAVNLESMLAQVVSGVLHLEVLAARGGRGGMALLGGTANGGIGGNGGHWRHSRRWWFS